MRQQSKKNNYHILYRQWLQAQIKQRERILYPGIVAILLTFAVCAVCAVCFVSKADAKAKIRRADIVDDAIGEEQVDWGTGSEQVAGADVPVADGGWANLNPATADVQATFDWCDDNWPSGGSVAPADAQYLVLTLDGDLDAERRLVPGYGLAGVDGGANGDYTLNSIIDQAANLISPVTTTAHVRFDTFEHEEYDLWDEQASIPTPSSGDVNTGAKTDGRMYSVDDGGNEHDWTCLSKQTWHIAQSTNNSTTPDLPYETGAYPGGALIPTITYVNTIDFDLANSEMDSAYGRYEWTSVGLPGDLITHGAQVMLGVPTRKWGDGSDRDGNSRIVVKARLRINEADRFSAIYLVVNDVDEDDIPQNQASADVLSALEANEGDWTEVTLAASGTDIGDWETTLRVSIHALNTTLTAGCGLTRLDFEWISAEFWAN